MSKVLVTGSGGYIGRHVVKSLLDKGHEVIALDINNDSVDSRAQQLNISILECDETIYEKTGRPDVCIHLAWRNGFIHNAESHMSDLSGHFNFLMHMIKGGLKNVAVMGSMHEVGYYEGAINENSPCSPTSLYGIAKNALRQSLIQLTESNNVNLYWLRAYYILGDDLHNHSVFTNVLRSASEGKKKFPFNSGKNLYDFIDVETLAYMIASAATQQEVTGVINVCTGNPVSLGEKITQFINEHHLDITLDYGAFKDRDYDSPGVWGDAAKINRIMENLEESVC